MQKTDQTGFQLDKKELMKDVPLIAKGLMGSLIDYVNALDVNHDGKADLCELAPFFIKALPIIEALLPLIDKKKLIQWFMSHDFVIDAIKAEQKVKPLLALIEALPK